MQNFWALAQSTAFKVNFVIYFITIMTYFVLFFFFFHADLAIPRTTSVYFFKGLETIRNM